MKVLVIGAGSIGKRHAENAKVLAGDAAVFDLDEAKAKATGLRSFSSLDDALAWQPDGVVVATPHNTHLEVAAAAVNGGAHVLIEKPIAHRVEGVDDFLRRAQRRVYVVCNMRFHPAVKALRENMGSVGEIYYAHAQYGNYLPNMRPGADYRDLYCARKNQGGGVLLDAIHEIDYLTWFFGPAADVFAASAKCSDLDIDVEDYAALSVRHESGVRSEIHLDYLQKCKRRGCEIIGSDGTLVWVSEGKSPEACTVRMYRDGWKMVYESPDVDSSVMYREMMDAFVQELKNPGSRPALLRGIDAAMALRTVLSAHESAAAGKKLKVEYAEENDNDQKCREAL